MICLIWVVHKNNPTCFFYNGWPAVFKSDYNKPHQKYMKSEFEKLEIRKDYLLVVTTHIPHLHFHFYWAFANFYIIHLKF